MKYLFPSSASRFPSSAFCLLLAAFCLLSTASCAAAPSTNPPWTYADLRRLDAASDAPAPAADLLAVYTRLAGDDLQIRLDLLDLTLSDDAGYEFQLWDEARYASAPLVVQIPAAGRLQLIQPASVVSPMQARLSRDPALDTLTLSLNRYFIGRHYRFDVRTYTPATSFPEDEALDIRSDDPPPASLAPLLIAFTDAFPAYTPAQALRRWDGAHTGPTGERHGLRQVLLNAERFHVPIALLDLKTPPGLAALDFIGATARLRQMAQEGLLILPDVAYGEPMDVSMGFSRRASANFGLPLSPFVYATAQELVPGSNAQFVSLPDASHLSRFGAKRLIPLAVQGEDPQADLNGPSLAVRKALMEAALSPDPADLVVLGGSLPHSTWGQADRAAAAFAWLAAHPWIHILDGADLMTFPIGAEDQPATNIITGGIDFPGFLPLPDNAISDSAWQTYFMLSAPTSDALLSKLREKYSDQLSVLWLASDWAEDPVRATLCLSKFCILSNEYFFAFIATDGARLTHLFYLDANGPHQLITPSYQFIVGLSDPSTWQLDQGEAADPSVLPGAFSDDSETWAAYKPVTSASAITLTSPDGRRIKTFRLTEVGLTVTYQVEGAVNTRIPLAVDPQTFYFASSKPLAILSPGSWTWGPDNGLRLQVHTDAAFTAQGFTVSTPFLSRPENPDLDYPPGHFYPFPLSIVTIHAQGSFIVEIVPLK
jgi:hypothetical protein